MKMRRNINNQRQNFIQNQTQAQHQQQRKIEIINKIETLKYNNKNISILIANLQNLFDKLEKIDTDINDSSKIGILNRCLPENLRWINVFQYSKWNDCCNYVKRVIREIILSNAKESNHTCNNQNNILFNINKNKNNINKNQNKIKFERKRKNVGKENKIDLKYIISQYNLADGLTKYLNGTFI